MRMANGKHHARLMFTEEEYLKLSDNGARGTLYVSVDPKSETSYLCLSWEEIPHSRRVAWSRQSSASKYPDTLNLTRSQFGSAIPEQRFGPEEVILTRDRDYHATGGWKTTRPAMQRAPLLKAPPSPDKPRAVRDRTKTRQASTRGDALMDLREAIRVVNEAKTRMGDDLVLEISKDTGRLSVLLSIGE